jgi:L-threonylcarbamoyladenylate synthase
MVKASTAPRAELAAAVAALRNGEVVAFPTETVYGLGADAQRAAAVQKIFTLKGRPATHPLIVHLAHAGLVPHWARELPAAASRLAARFWPGPLTLVLPRAPAVLDLVTGGQDSVALRVPAHPLAQQLLAAFGGGIAAPSANRHGRVSPTRAEHVREEFGDAVGVVLDGGECTVGIESTIVACLYGTVRLLRPGQISLAELRAEVGAVASGAVAGAPRTPGSMPAHYAPATPLRLVAAEQIEALAVDLARGGARIGVLAQRLPRAQHARVNWVAAGARAAAYAHDLYAHLRTLDQLGAACLLVQEVPDDARWDAVRDRLTRAAAATAPELGELP